MVLDDIEKAKEKIIGLNKDKRNYLDDYFLKLYLMSTENLAGYLKNYNFKDNFTECKKNIKKKKN